MIAKMESILKDDFLLWTMSEYVELRDIACARLTLFNARRGGEPARLSIAELAAIKHGLILQEYRLCLKKRGNYSL